MRSRADQWPHGTWDTAPCPPRRAGRPSAVRRGTADATGGRTMGAPAGAVWAGCQRAPRGGVARRPVGVGRPAGAGQMAQRSPAAVDGNRRRLRPGGRRRRSAAVGAATSGNAVVLSGRGGRSHHAPIAPRRFPGGSRKASTAAPPFSDPNTVNTTGSLGGSVPRSPRPGGASSTSTCSHVTLAGAKA